MKKQSGFTLIELLLVLAIIGIISAVAIPALLNQRSRARDRVTVANMVGSFSECVGAYDIATETGADPKAAIKTVVDALKSKTKNPWNTKDGNGFVEFDTAATNPGESGYQFTEADPGAAATEHTPAKPAASAGLIGTSAVKNKLDGAAKKGDAYIVTKTTALD